VFACVEWTITSDNPEFCHAFPIKNLSLLEPFSKLFLEAVGNTLTHRDTGKNNTNFTNLQVHDMNIRGWFGQPGPG